MYTPIVAYTISLATLALLADTGMINPLCRGLHSVAYGDKLAHFLIAGSLALVANLTMLRARPGRLRPVVGATLAVALLVTAEEFSNHLTPRRGFSLYDLGANYLGVILVGVAPLAVWRGAKNFVRRRRMPALPFGTPEARAC